MLILGYLSDRLEQNEAVQILAKTRQPVLKYMFADSVAIVLSI
jgi:hypothetical protein